MNKEGQAVHVYTSNASMGNRAFCSNDGDMLIVPQLGRLDIQTEFGRCQVKDQLNVVDVQELFGSRYELPELGPFGSNGLALPRDFEFPIASFDMDNSEWETLNSGGSYVPFKYAAEKFITAAYTDKDQADPSLYTVLTAKSKIPGVSVTDFMFFCPKYSSATNTFRPPYYHRNMATEVVGIVYGDYKGTSRNLEAGGLSFQSSYMPHGETHEAFEKATTSELKPLRVGEGFLASLWDSMQGHFFEHVQEVNEELKRRGLPVLGSTTQ
ncbi:hypothetical protein COL26b_003115 [Colletotrichum chrysophilum]|uniref:uncharacterized protein n=1 Tax=Colletotrichum chrysophilum TaxID=1836956 RepID=UPI0023016DBA|nr:uncharacterized protein COL26b_003115 [Colletotrichum chrysophilum]KAJ0378516.1 hypothetical protein COL26b_003115 [Colletotrichum chrysophilum]